MSLPGKIGWCGWLLAVLAGTGMSAPPPNGRFLPPEQFASETLGTNRTVRIWLPPSYAVSLERRYPVLYLHDGQNVFSSAGPHVAFGWGNWEVDLTVERLVTEQRMREIILVGIDNTPRRYQEYRGRAATFTEEERKTASRAIEPGDNSAFERYTKFLITELKPSIDRRFRTLAGPTHTGALGSSMGGICSLALAWDHPEVFGLAASLSGAFQVEQEAFLEQVLKSRAAPLKPVKLYLDSGATSFNGGDDGRANTEAVVAELRRIGWRDDKNLRHFVDEPPLTPEQLAPLKLAENKFKEAQFSQHNELYWRLRVWRALEFLFPPEQLAAGGRR